MSTKLEDFINKPNDSCVLALVEGGEKTFPQKSYQLLHWWKTLNCTVQKGETTSSLKKFFEWLYEFSMDLILDAKWSRIKRSIKNEILREVERSKNIYNDTEDKIKYIIRIILHPWKFTTLTKIFSKSKTSLAETLDFFESEGAFLTKMRLKKLIENDCSDLALRLADCIIKCFMIKDATKFHSMICGEDKDYILDVNVLTLYDYNKTKQITELIKVIGVKESLSIAERFLYNDSRPTPFHKHRLPVSELIIQAILASTMVENSVCDKELNYLLKMFFDIHIEQAIVTDIPEKLRKLTQFAVSSTHFYICCRYMLKKFGDQFRTFIIELFLRGLTTDLNEYDKQKQKGDYSFFRVMGKRLAEAYLEMAALFELHVGVKREFILTAFSVDPTESHLELIIEVAKACGKLKIEPEEPEEDTSEGGGMCKLHTDEPGDNLCPDCGDWVASLNIPEPFDGGARTLDALILIKGDAVTESTNYDVLSAPSQVLDSEVLGVTSQICDDLAVVLSSPRYHLLSWVLDWAELRHACEQYLYRSTNGSMLNTELKYLNIDYDQFKHSNTETDTDPYSGIERGYEKWLELESETDSALTSEEETEDDDDDNDDSDIMEVCVRNKIKTLSTDSESYVMNTCMRNRIKTLSTDSENENKIRARSELYNGGQISEVETASIDSRADSLGSDGTQNKKNMFFVSRPFASITSTKSNNFNSREKNRNDYLTSLSMFPDNKNARDPSHLKSLRMFRPSALKRKQNEPPKSEQVRKKLNVGNSAFPTEIPIIEISDSDSDIPSVADTICGGLELNETIKSNVENTINVNTNTDDVTNISVLNPLSVVDNENNRCKEVKNDIICKLETTKIENNNIIDKDILLTKPMIQIEKIAKTDDTLFETNEENYNSEKGRKHTRKRLSRRASDSKKRHSCCDENQLTAQKKISKKFELNPRVMLSKMDPDLIPRVLLTRLDQDKKNVSVNNKKEDKKLLANVPGLNSLDMVRPALAQPVVRVVQLVHPPDQRTSTQETSSSVSTPVTAHIQRVGQPSAAVKSCSGPTATTTSMSVVSSMSGQTSQPISVGPAITTVTPPVTTIAASASVSITSTSASNSASTNNSTLISYYTHQVLRPTDVIQGVIGNYRARPPVVNIISQQILRPPFAQHLTTATSTGVLTGTVTATMNPTTAATHPVTTTINSLSTTTSSSGATTLLSTGSELTNVNVSTVRTVTAISVSNTMPSTGVVKSVTENKTVTSEQQSDVTTQVSTVRVNTNTVESTNPVHTVFTQNKTVKTNVGSEPGTIKAIRLLGKVIPLASIPTMGSNVRLQATPSSENTVLDTTANKNIKATKIIRATANVSGASSRSVYEENYTKFIHTPGNSVQSKNENEDSAVANNSVLPKFQQAFGKSVYRNATDMDENSTVEVDSSHNDEIPVTAATTTVTSTVVTVTNSAANAMHVSTPPLLVKRAVDQRTVITTTPSSLSSAQKMPLVVGPMSPLNVQTIQGGSVIYARHVTGTAGNQEINLIPTITQANPNRNPILKLTSVGTSQDQSTSRPLMLSISTAPIMVKDTIVRNNVTAILATFNSGGALKQTPIRNSAIVSAARAIASVSNSAVTSSKDLNASGAETDDKETSASSSQTITPMRIVPVVQRAAGSNLISTGQMKPVLLRSPVVLSAGTSAGTVRLPVRSRNVSENAIASNSIEPSVSSTTLEQLREFDKVMEQVKERSTVQPGSQQNAPQASGEEFTNAHNQNSSEAVFQSENFTPTVCFPQRVSVAYITQAPLNQKATTCPPVVVVTTYCNLQPAPSPALSVTSQSSSSPCVTPSPISGNNRPAIKSSGSKSSKGKSVKTSTSSASKSPIPKPQQKPQEDEETAQRIYDILAEYAEQLQNSPDLNNKPAPRRRSNPPTNPNQTSKRKKSSGSKKTVGPAVLASSDTSPSTEDHRTMGSEDSSSGVMHTSIQDSPSQGLLSVDDTQSTHSSDVRNLQTESNDAPTPIEIKPQCSTRQIILTEANSSRRGNVIFTDTSVTEALAQVGKVGNTAIIVPGNYILPVSVMKGGQQITVVSGGSKIYSMKPLKLPPVSTSVTASQSMTATRITLPTSRPIERDQSTLALTETAEGFTINFANNENTSNLASTQISDSCKQKLNEIDDNECASSTKIALLDDDNNKTETSTDEPNGSDSVPVGHANCDATSTATTNGPMLGQLLSDQSTSCLALGDSSDGCEQDCIPSSQDGVSTCVQQDQQSPKPFLSRKVWQLKTSMSSANSEAQRTSESLFRPSTGMQYGSEVDASKKRFVGSSANCASVNVLVSKSDKARQNAVNLQAQRKQAAMERELRLQKSLSEECEDLGVDEPSTSDLFPEADLLFDSQSPTFDHMTQDAACSQNSEKQYTISDYRGIDSSSNSHDAGFNKEMLEKTPKQGRSQNTINYLIEPHQNKTELSDTYYQDTATLRSPSNFETLSVDIDIHDDNSNNMHRNDFSSASTKKKTSSVNNGANRSTTQSSASNYSDSSYDDNTTLITTCTLISDVTIPSPLPPSTSYCLPSPYRPDSPLPPATHNHLYTYSKRKEKSHSESKKRSGYSLYESDSELSSSEMETDSRGSETSSSSKKDNDAVEADSVSDTASDPHSDITRNYSRKKKSKLFLCEGNFVGAFGGDPEQSVQTTSNERPELPSMVKDLARSEVDLDTSTSSPLSLTSDTEPAVSNRRASQRGHIKKGCPCCVGSPPPTKKMKKMASHTKIKRSSQSTGKKITGKKR